MISVVIPAYNEMDSVSETIAEVRSVLADVEHEIVVVDDGSSDATSERACTAGARVLRHPHNLGYGAALKTGIRGAKGDTIVITDADGTYPGEYIPVLLKEYAVGFDMAVGSRTGEHYWSSAFKSPMRLILKWLVEFTTGRRVPDVNSGLRVFSREQITPYLDHLCNSFSFTTSLTLAYMMTSKFVAYLPIPYHKRMGRTKVRLFRDAMRTMQYIVEAIIYYNPLKMFVLLSFGLLLVSGLLLFSAAMLRSTSLLYIGVASLLTMVIVFCMGLLAELLRQVVTRR